MRIALLAGLLAVTASRALAGTPSAVNQELAKRLYELDPRVRPLTAKYLDEMGIDYEAKARENLIAKGETFDYVQVEVTGVMSSDDTDTYDKGLFDLQIKPSFTNYENENPVQRARREFLDALDPAGMRKFEPDMVEYMNAAAGVTTARAYERLKPLMGREVNVLVAHSWGTELVYAAILNGVIKPPKKLVVVGVPDDDKEKWRQLALWTGTKVHWARADNDAVAINGARDIARRYAKGIDFKQKWEAQCAVANPNTDLCHPHGRASQVMEVEPVGALAASGAGHSRTEYYDVMKRNFTLRGRAETLRVTETEIFMKEVEEVKLEAAGIAQRKARARVDQMDAEAAEEARKRAESVVQQPIALIPVPVAPAVPVAVPVPVQAARPLQPSEFGLAMANIAKYATQTCAQVGSADTLYLNYYQHSYQQYFGSQANWQHWFDMEYYRLSGCERELFVDIVTLALNQNTWQVYDRTWLQQHVDRYAPRGSNPGYSAPRRGSDNSSTTTPPSTPPHDTDGEAKRQLEEIERDARLRKAFGLPPRHDW